MKQKKIFFQNFYKNFFFTSIAKIYPTTKKIVDDVSTLKSMVEVTNIIGNKNQDNPLKEKKNVRLSLNRIKKRFSFTVWTRLQNET